MKVLTKLLLKPKDFSPSFKNWKVLGALNPGAVRMKNGKIVLYVRIAESSGKTKLGSISCPRMASKKEYRANYMKISKKQIIRRGVNGEMYLKNGTCILPHISHFKKVILSSDGLKVEEIQSKPAFTGIPGDGDFGVEDPRITQIGEKYFMTYVGVSQTEGISTYLAESNNLIKWKRRGLIFSEQNKDAVLFPQKISGRFVALNRPESSIIFSKPSIWISYSKDLIYWGKDRSLMKPRDNSWEDSRIGAGCPPLKTDKGWLVIYHGAKIVKDKHVYSAGVALLDLRNPEIVLARTSEKEPLFKPSLNLEKKGYISNVVFPTGLVSDNDNKDLLIYSGGADSIVTVRKISLKQIWKHLEV